MLPKPVRGAPLGSGTAVGDGLGVMIIGYGDAVWAYARPKASPNNATAATKITAMALFINLSPPFFYLLYKKSTAKKLRKSKKLES
jgi:hypothetical protein